VVLVARGRDALAAAAAAIGPRAVALAHDLADTNDTERAVSEIMRTAGAPSVVVNNAGAFTLGRVGSYEPAEFERTFAVNAFGPFRLLHAFVPAMVAAGKGHVVTVGSVADRHTFPENAGYAGSKFAMRAVHQVLREELRGTGVRTTLVSPSPVDTMLWDPIRPETRTGFPTRDRMLQAEDVAEAVLWALSRPAHVNVDEVRLSRS
jgi:NADP-dependent 3-hydroxy acid dehydrogenase YdfG